MLGITDMPAFLLVTTVTILLPGPNSLFVLSVAARQGVRDGYRAAGGVFAGDALLMLASVAGLAPLLAAYPQVFTVLKLVGAGYLAWMGLGLIRAAVARWQQAEASLSASEQSGEWIKHPFRRTLGICLLNPKAIFFFMAFFIQFVDKSYAYPLLSFAVLGVILQCISLAYLSALIFAGSRLAGAFRARRRLAVGGTGGAGLVFIGFGAKLATAAQ